MAGDTVTSVSIILIHGDFVDGSSWEPVYNILRKDDYRVSVVQNRTLSLTDDVAATKRVIARETNSVILVGHSYGGVVITEAGNDPKVAGLVYIAAFAPDKGESVASLVKNPAPGAPIPPILPAQDGYLLLDRTKFATSFAADLPKEKANFMADAQLPWGLGAWEAPVTEAAWRSKPSWYLVATEDRMIPPAAQRAMSSRVGARAIEVKGSHAIHVSKPDAVAALIKRAAKGTRASTPKPKRSLGIGAAYYVPFP